MTPPALVGTGRRPVLLLHGFLGSGRNLAGLASRLAASDASLAIAALDLPGHGEGPPLSPAADLAGLAAEVLATARKRGLAPPFRLVGHSLGGRVALRAGLLEPASVAHVTLLDIAPSAVTRRGETHAIVETLLDAPPAAASREVFRAHFRAAGLAAPIVDWLLLNLERAGGGHRWRIDRRALAELHERTAREDLWAAIEGPRGYGAHAIRGALSPYVDDAEARRLAAAGCPVDTIAGAGHWLHVEQPEAVVERVLARLP